MSRQSRRLICKTAHGSLSTNSVKPTQPVSVSKARPRASRSSSAVEGRAEIPYYDKMLEQGFLTHFRHMCLLFQHSDGKKERDHEYFITNSHQKKCKKKQFLGIHDRFIRDEEFRKNMHDVGRHEICRETDKLANEDHTHHATPDEIRVYRNNWWIRSNFVGSDTMPVRHRADFKEAVSTLRRLKNQEDQAYYQKWQSTSSSWWDWQDSWWHSSSEYHRDDGPSTVDRGNLLDSDWANYSWNDSQH